MTRNEAIQLAQFVFACFPHATVGADNIAAYTRFLEKLHPEPAWRAAEQVIDQPGRGYVPTIGELRSAYNQMRRDEPMPALPARTHPGLPRLPATPDQAWTIESATWARVGHLPGGWTQADLAEHEAAAEARHMARGTTPQERTRNLKREVQDALKKMSRPTLVTTEAP